jgi:hypothetical protein
MEAIVKTQNTNVAISPENVFALPSVRRVEKSEVFYAVNSAVARAFADTGFSIPGDTLAERAANGEYLVNELTDNIIAKFPNLRHQEIAIAFSRGIRLEYCEKFFGLSVVTFETFITGYLESEKRLELARQAAMLENHKLTAKVKPTDDEIFSMALTNVSNALRGFKSSGTVQSVGGVVYDFLSALKLIDYSSEEKQEMFDQAKEALHSEAIAKKAECLDRIKRIELGRVIDNLNGGGEKSLIIARAKRICVEEFFRSCEMNDTDVIELVKSARP